MARTTRARRRLTLLAILLGSTALAGVGTYAGITFVRARAIEAARVEGYSKFEAGDFAGALEHLSRYVAKHRDDYDALMKLAACRAKVVSPNRRHLVDAAAFYREALKLRPGSLDALNGLIDAYKDLGYGPELEQVADELLRIDPKNVGAIESRMMLAGARGAWADAAKHCEQLVELEPDVYRWRILLLEVMRQTGADLAKRVERIQSWIAKGETDGRYQLMLADAMREGNDRANAEAAAKKAADMGMPDAAMLGVLVELLDSLNMPEVVQQAIDKARAQGLGQAEIVNMQVRRHWLAGRLVDAKQQLDAIANPTPEEKIEILRWRVMLAEAERDPQASDAYIAEMRALVQADPRIAERDVRWLDAVQQTRNAESGGPLLPRIAIGLLQLAIASSPKDTFLMLRAGEVSLRAGEPDEAARYFGMAFQRESGRWALAGIRETAALLAVGRTEEAFRRARDLTARFSSNPSTFFVFAQACDALAREGRSPSSVDPSFPRDVTASNILGTLYEKLDYIPAFLPPLLGTLLTDEDFDEATRLANRAIADARTPVDILLQIAAILSDRRFGDVPSRAIEAAVARSPSGSDGTAVVMARARLQIARGEAMAAKSMLADALQTAQGEVRTDLAILRTEAAIAAGSDDVTAFLSEVLREGGQDLDAVSFVLSQTAAWEDESLISAAVSKLGELVGETAPRTVLTAASRVLRFRRTEAEEVAKAIQNVDRILELNKDSTAAIVTLARLFAAAQPPDVEKAANYLKKAVALQPGRRDLYPELIAMLQSSGNFSDANHFLQQYMRSAEGDSSQARMAAGLMVQQGQYLNAIPALERVAAQTGAEADLVALGDAERRAGRMEQAEKAFKAALEGDDRSALSAMAYAEFLARSGRLADARAVVTDDAKRAKPALTPANRAYLQARLELDYGDPAAARPAIEEALKLASNSAGVMLLAAREKLSSGDTAAALEFANKGLTIAPKDQHLLAFVASLLMADPTSRARSEATLSKLTEENPALGELLAIVKACASPDGKIAPGPAQLAALSELTSRYPAEPAVWTVAIELHAATGKTEEALRLARSGMARLPAEPGPAELAARLLLELRRTGEARDAARTWRSLTADSPLGADLLLARISLIAGKPAEAVATLQPYATRLTKESENDPQSLGLFAAAYLFDGQVEQAFAAIKPGLEREATSGRPERMLLAEWLRAIRTAPTAAAMDALARSEPILATDDTGRIALATEFVALARRKSADGAAERAGVHLDALSPNVKSLPIAQLLSADLAAIRGDVPAASAIYQAAWQGLPAEVRDQLLRWSAISDTERAALAGPRSIALFAANNQASTLARAGVDLDTALTTIDRALVMAPDDPALLETKAEVLLAKKDYSQARAILEPIVNQPDCGPSPRLVLARVEIAAGRVDDARRLVQTADRLLGEDPFADRALIEALADVKKVIDQASRRPTA